MSTTTYKAQQVAEDLKQALSYKFTTVSDVAFDTDGCAYITATNGTLVAGQQCALVKLTGVALLGVDGLGSTPRSFAGTVAQVVLETSTISAVALMTEANKFNLFATVAQFGTKVELYMSANTTAVALGQITSGNLKQTWYPSTKYPGMSGLAV